MSPRLRGLYAVTPDGSTEIPPRTPQRLARAVEQAILGGARLVQYRDKGRDPMRRLAEATELTRLCRRLDVPLIVNDDLDLALSVGAAGVHLGREDGDPSQARERLGPEAILGVSCYDRLDLAQAAQRAGASYVAFGSFFHSSTKPDAVRPGIALLAEARASLSVPLVAIGGIAPENGGSLIAAGADLLAVASGIFAAADIAGAARAYSQLFSAGASPTEDPR